MDPLQSPRSDPGQEERMTVETPSFFNQVIEDHLELKRRNAELEGNLPLERYMSGDPFENHPLFKTEEQARLEETMETVEPAVTAHMMRWPGEERLEEEDEDKGLWGRSRDFDWGD
jgi:hypothetical protein